MSRTAKLGANEIVPEELETSIEIFARLFPHYEVPRNLIWDFVERLRRDHYEILRDDRHTLNRVQFADGGLLQLDVDLISIREGSPSGRAKAARNQPACRNWFDAHRRASRQTIVDKSRS